MLAFLLKIESALVTICLLTLFEIDLHKLLTSPSTYTLG